MATETRIIQNNLISVFIQNSDVMGKQEEFAGADSINIANDYEVVMFLLGFRGLCRGCHRLPVAGP